MLYRTAELRSAQLELLLILLYLDGTSSKRLKVCCTAQHRVATGALTERLMVQCHQKKASISVPLESTILMPGSDRTRQVRMVPTSR